MSTVVTTPWQAIRMHPLRFLISGWPWRCLLYLACGVFAALPALAVGRWISLSGSITSYLVSVLGVLLISLLGAVPFAALERRRLGILNPEWARRRSGHERPGGPVARLRAWLREQDIWREFGYALVTLTILSLINLAVTVSVLGILFAPLGAGMALILDTGSGPTGGLTVNVPTIMMIAGVWLLIMPVAAYATTAVAAGQAALARFLLLPSGTTMAAKVQELSQSRLRLVDVFEAERSRIERDLHDGAQQRLVSLAMTLGMAELSLADDRTERADSDVARLVVAARKEAQAALGELRELIRGIHPQVLTDLGIEAAVAEVTTRCPIPVGLDIDLPRRPARSVEAVAYFVVSEALANVVKHSQARRAEVAGAPAGAGFVLTVVDDGIGGADPRGGTGLQGLVDRVAVVGGKISLSSPPGGPTELRVELPWHPDSE
ncbi:sensor histidine kinase [Actinoalloteichus hymeniacidonis]|uniref:histidine kinase n=1 Tax=Actinoalloteichus hymeniacidonis TaxID=340345 RepID=A0AAC9HRL7_9PSEU|nr:sensor domain-containing protein [Actinoalloteichus hymeniacidonis]AOS64073.1 signal transduction histidine kinase [Actinoalloteichus hymeniacidonis]MBB5907865.1 signal transduction histidine kinase [Actinoalloteichus hymeniacidonis]